MAVPGFGLRGGGTLTLSTGGWGKSWKVLNVEVKVIYLRVVTIFLLLLSLQLVANEASEEQKRKKIAFKA